MLTPDYHLDARWYTRITAKKRAVTFRSYYGRFIRRLWKEGWKSAWEQIVLALLLAIAATAVSFQLGYIKLAEGRGSVLGTAITYCVALAIFVVYLLLRTPWLLDDERAEEIAALGNQV